MSLNAALSIARSGLTVTSRAAELTSQNVANALTEGYGRRDLALSARMTGGVSVTGTVRFADQALIADRRIAQAGATASQSGADFLARLEAAIGTPETAGSLGTLVSGLETALIDAASLPQSELRLGTIVTSAQALTDRIGAVSADVQAARQGAETKIAAAVTDINAALQRIEGLNTAIATGGNRDVSALMDQRQQLVDVIADQIPLREIDRGDGRIALMSTSGATLLDGKAAVLGFERAGVITAEMTQASGGLSGLTLNGQPLALSGPVGVGGGDLAAQFAIRDTLAPQAQAAVDAFAADLTTRFAGTGLFVDGAVNPVIAAEPWRLRDGIDALAKGPEGDASRLNAMTSAFAGVSGKAAELLSGVSSQRVTADTAASFAAARSDTLRVAELQGGVDTDHEMQKLLLIEQSYAANAKVIQAVDNLMQILLGI